MTPESATTRKAEVPRGTLRSLANVPRGTAPIITPETLHLCDLLEQGFEELALPLGTRERDLLVELADLVAARNQTQNLTGHRDAEAIVRFLVLDAAALSRELPSFELLADLGSGAGFPGFPLAILYPSRSFTLVEARTKRHHFQRAVVRGLGLENVATRLGRAEVLDPTISDGVIAQAMGNPRLVVNWMLPWVAEGGFAAIPAGPTPIEPSAVPYLREAESRRYQVPLDGRRRTLWIARP